MKKSYLYIFIILFMFLGFLGGKVGIANIMFLINIFLIAVLILTKYENITYFLAMYPFIDFGFRSFVPSMASIWDELLFIAMFFVWFYKYLLYRKEKEIKQTPLDLSIILFLSAMLIVFIINSPDYKISLEGFRAVIQYVLWYFALIQLIKDEQTAKNICLVFVLVVSIMAIHGVYQFIIGVEMPANWVDSKEAGVRTRVFSILTSPNIFGSLITLALPICFSFLIITKKLAKKLIFLVFTVMMLGALVFTFSRGAWIGFGAAVCLYVFLKDKRLFIPVIILGILVVFLVPGVGNRISYMLSPEYIESSLRGGRLVRWITGIKILSGTPLLGVGLGHFGGAVAMNNNLSYLVGTDLINTYYMDNYYLKMAVETGIFGILSFIMLMYQVVINGLRTIKITKVKEIKELEIGILSGLFGIIIHNFFENVFEVPMMTSCFWFLVTVLMSFWYINYHKNNN